MTMIVSGDTGWLLVAVAGVDGTVSGGLTGVSRTISIWWGGDEGGVSCVCR